MESDRGGRLIATLSIPHIGISELADSTLKENLLQGIQHFATDRECIDDFDMASTSKAPGHQTSREGNLR